MMFTGIVETTAPVLRRTESSLILGCPQNFTDIVIGSSICVSGVCLSVTECDRGQLIFAVVPETWKCTKLGSLSAGDTVNLERALKADGRFDGHIVQGHVETVGEVGSLIRSDDGSGMLTVHIPPELLPFIVAKGSIAFDGVSLTVALLKEDAVVVALIPHTLTGTTLGNLHAGDSVNIETDILARYAKKFSLIA
ncbi:MAG: riboflavin synthase [Candidatus Peribacteraceae bacterium]